MIKILSGDIFSQKFLDDLIAEHDDMAVGYDEYDFDKTEEFNILTNFLEIKANAIIKANMLTPIIFTNIKDYILQLYHLEKLNDKNVVLLNPLSTLHEYFIVKYVNKIVDLHKDHKHNFTIVSNNIHLINQFRVNIVTKKLDCEDFKIQFYWENECSNIECNKNGRYPINIPRMFDSIDTDQMAELVNLNN